MNNQNHIANSNPLPSFLKLFNARLQVLNLLSYFLSLVCLLCLGIFLVSYGKNLSVNLQPSQFKISFAPNSNPNPNPNPNSKHLLQTFPPSENKSNHIPLPSLQNFAPSNNVYFPHTSNESDHIPPPPLQTLAPSNNVYSPHTSNESDHIPPPQPNNKGSTNVSSSKRAKPKPESSIFARIPRNPPIEAMEDEELLRRAWRSPRIVSGEEFAAAERVPKVAFMFLTKGPLPMAPLWEKFFKGQQGLFSIYVHSDPSYNQPVPESSVFHARRVPSKEVGWGEVNMIEAERRLLGNALLDPANHHFVLLSESCIPLFNLSTIRSHLLGSAHSFVESFDQPGPVGRGRYTPRMRPTVSIQQWRKGSQWFQIDRALAHDVVSDRTYFPVFARFCTDRCYSDEHYLATLVGIRAGSRNANRTLTWVDWSRGGPHPRCFRREHVTYGFLEWLRGGSTCLYNGVDTNVCYLFARKFGTHALDRLLRFAPKIMHFHN